MSNTPPTPISITQLIIAIIGILLTIVGSWVNINSRLAILESENQHSKEKISEIMSYLKAGQEEQSQLIKAQTDILIKLEQKQNRP